jgi:valyl-tRNA synthetase
MGNGISGGVGDHTGPGIEPKLAVNKWIIGEVVETLAELDKAMAELRFDAAANTVYHFVWDQFCDWYIELIKGSFDAETRTVAGWVLDQILVMLHPFMPFITEELWAVAPGPARDGLLALSQWPQLEGLADDKAEAEIGWVIDLITAVRSLRAEMNITAQTPLVLANVSDETKARAERWAEFIKRLARVSEMSSASSAPQGSVQLVVRGEVAALPLKGVIDLAAERARLDKEMAKADADIKRVDAKLSNESFVARAPEEVVEEEKEKRAEAVARKDKIAAALATLRDAT